jgi:hypothetical protein
MTAEDYNNSIIEMNSQDYVDLANQQSNDEAIRFEDLDDAIIGTDQNGLLVYDYHQMVVTFINQGMAADDAIEWIDYNVLSINAGNGFSVVFT